MSAAGASPLTSSPCIGSLLTSACEPSTAWKTSGLFIRWHVEVEVDEVDVTDLGPLVPAKHGVYGLAELCAAALADATGVGPAKLDAICSGLAACVEDLSIASLPGDIR